MSALIMRVIGRRVIVMNDSKFDDYDRIIWREVLKSFMYAPYHGALVASRRSASYLSFLGIPKQNIHFNYDNLSIRRIRELVKFDYGPDKISFENRTITIVARFVPKKNLLLTLDAYALYARRVIKPRRLVLCGGGPLESELVAHAKALGIFEFIEFNGFLSQSEIAHYINNSLVLLLLSTEEQFGQVVLEAQALQVPVIVSNAVGANDFFVRNGTNGFIVEPDDCDGAAKFIEILSANETVWRQLALATDAFAIRADASHFAKSVDDLIKSLSGKI